MLRTRHTADASDLLVDGTYALRRGLAQLVRRPALRLERASGEHARHNDRPDRTSLLTTVRPRVGTRDCS